MLRFKTCDHGATAIEYAIIAGLIGLGLVGSLVTTRGSLSSIFGTAGSQMASGVSGTGAAGGAGGSAPNAAVGSWANKTLVGPPTKTVYDANMTYWTFNYTDGSTAWFYRGAGGGVSNNLSLTDKANHTNETLRTSLTGVGQSYNIMQYAADDTTRLQLNYSNTGQGAEFGGTPPAPITQAVMNFTNNAAQPSQTLSAPTQTFKDQAAAAAARYGYFEGMSK